MDIDGLTADTLDRIAAAPGLPAVAALACRDDDVLEPLARVAAALPGAHLFRAGWLDDPLVWCAVEAYEASWPARCVLAAYGPLLPSGTGERTPHRLWRGEYVLAVPATLGQLCEWSQGAGASHDAALLPGGLLAGVLADPTAAAAHAATATRMWRTTALNDLAVIETGVLLEVAAALHSVASPATVDRACQIAATVEGDLLSDALDDGMLAATLLALARSGTPAPSVARGS